MLYVHCPICSCSHEFHFFHSCLKPSIRKPHSIFSGHHIQTEGKIQLFLLWAQTCGLETTIFKSPIQLKFLKNKIKNQFLFMPLTATTNFSFHSKQDLNWKTTKSFTSTSAFASGAMYGQPFIHQSRGMVNWLTPRSKTSHRCSILLCQSTDSLKCMALVVSTLRHMKPVHDLLRVSYFSKIHLHITIPFIPTFSFRFSNHKPIRLLPHVRHVCGPHHFSFF